MRTWLRSRRCSRSCPALRCSDRRCLRDSPEPPCPSSPPTRATTRLGAVRIDFRSAHTSESASFALFKSSAQADAFARVEENVKTGGLFRIAVAPVGRIVVGVTASTRAQAAALFRSLSHISAAAKPRTPPNRVPQEIDYDASRVARTGSNTWKVRPRARPSQQRERTSRHMNRNARRPQAAGHSTRRSRGQRRRRSRHRGRVVATSLD